MDEIATPEEVIAKIREASELLKNQGQKALALLRDASSRFVWKDTYIFIIDLENSVALSNPAFPEREGGNIACTSTGTTSSMDLSYATRQIMAAAGLSLCGPDPILKNRCEK